MAPRDEAGRRRGDDGAAVVDFVFVSVLVLAILMGLLQLGLALHVRNTVTWAASEGARAGARLGSSPELGVQRTKELISQSLTSSYATDVTATRRVENGIAIVEVQVNASTPLIGLWGTSHTLTERGRAFAEDQ